MILIKPFYINLHIALNDVFNTKNSMQKVTIFQIISQWILYLSAFAFFLSHDNRNLCFAGPVLNKTLPDLVSLNKLLI